MQTQGKELTTLRGSRLSTVVPARSASLALQASYSGNWTATWHTPIKEGSRPLHAVHTTSGKRVFHNEAMPTSPAVPPSKQVSSPSRYDTSLRGVAHPCQPNNAIHKLCTVGR